MVDSGKCKMVYEDNEEEYAEFYEYEDEEEEDGQGECDGMCVRCVRRREEGGAG